MKKRNIVLIVLFIIVALFIFWKEYVKPVTIGGGQELRACESNMGKIYSVVPNVSESVPMFIVNGKLEYGCGAGYSAPLNQDCPVVSQLEFEWNDCSVVDPSEAKKIWRKVK